ncbi:MAG: hypothetical protein B6242_08100 [Anaerolineaceae bacterium 4572_78]|nr:MAG: hypothetical protein B6242_08100 [Anaerolineaceae bacterium 4572_78]
MTILERTRETPISIPPMPTIGRYLPSIPVRQDTDDESGKRVTLEEYWEYYYENGEHNYEYNNGYLEAKPLAKQIQAEMYGWVYRSLTQYLDVNPIARITTLEIGFKFRLPGKIQVRKPDLGIVRNDNPIILHDEDRNYKGKYDMCIEFVSDSNLSEIERDTKVKFREFQTIKVNEYFLFSDDTGIMRFYRMNKYGFYDEVKPDKHGVIRSKVLPGFQFRVSDLFEKPALIEMANDPVYQGFVLPEYQAEKQRAETERQRAETERQRAETEWQRANKLASKLRELGIDPDSL